MARNPRKDVADGVRHRFKNRLLLHVRLGRGRAKFAVFDDEDIAETARELDLNLVGEIPAAAPAEAKSEDFAETGEANDDLDLIADIGNMSLDNYDDKEDLNGITEDNDGSKDDFE